jgi:pyruvate ferredoxin oxidoreductase gamma subunit
MYRIRFHGRGGQGMKTASRILGSAFFRAGFEVQDAPRYGAERRGAPIFAYVRAARHSINERGIIQRPDLIIVADETLFAIPAAAVLQGISPQTSILIYGCEPAEQWRRRLNLSGPVFHLPAGEEPREYPALRFLGTSCAAAAAGLIGEISWIALEQAMNEELAHLGPAVMRQNLEQAQRAYKLMEPHQGSIIFGQPVAANHFINPHWVEPVFEDTSRSAPAIHAARTSELTRTGLWRTMRPVIDRSRCRGCWWICSTFCPDGAIRVDSEDKPQIDYAHCKGCMICLLQCPNHAIEAVSEQEAQTKEQGGDRP